MRYDDITACHFVETTISGQEDSEDEVVIFNIDLIAEGLGVSFTVFDFAIENYTHEYVFISGIAAPEHDQLPGKG